MNRAYVLGDWGTSRFRLYRISGGAVTGRLNGPGTGSLNTSAEQVLAERLEMWLEEGTLESVTLCGMAGAKGALVDAGYAPCPTGPDAWLSNRSTLSVAGVPVSVMPGLSCRTSRNIPEVMRGEETQVFGALALHPELADGEHLLALPGTHCKWVRVNNGRIEAFSTFPTGELFALLTGHSTLTGPDMPGTGSFDEGFARGFERREDVLTSALFEARAARMLDGKSQDWSRGFLSGLLIGAEAASQAVAGMEVALIGDPGLEALYEKALTPLGCSVRQIDAEASVIAGLELARSGTLSREQAL